MYTLNKKGKCNQMDKLQEIDRVGKQSILINNEVKVSLTETDYYWLIEQAEKVERYEKALEWYANKNNYERSQEDIMTGYPPEIMNDKGFEAKKALKD
jgi:RNase P/RNase MRP subunit p30